jgi:hypothetical protein
MKELRKRLLMEIATRLESDGYRKSQQTFTLDFPSVRWFFHVAFIPHADDFDVTADIAVRHDSIQRASRRYEHLEAKEKLMTATLGVELGNLQGIGQYRWTVRSECDVALVADSILKMFREVGVPFLKSFSSLDETKKVFLENGDIARLICPVRDQRDEIISIFRSETQT